MITVKIKQEFHDKDNFSKIYPVGSVCAFKNERAQELISLGLAEKTIEPERPRRARKIDE